MSMPIADVPSAQAAIAAAEIGAAISVVTLGWNLYLQQRAAAWKEQADRATERLRGELTLEGVQAKARLDYRYEALKRLYLSVEPLLFQTVERSEGAMHRIASLARAARQGHLSSGDGWLATDVYYLRSTAYFLLAPMATMRLIQRKLTAVDLSLDPWVASLYRLSRLAYWSFSDDFQFARGGNHEDDNEVSPLKLPYDPNIREWNTLRGENPAVYWRQGLPIGVLDQVIDAFAVPEGESLRVMSFGEFDDCLKNDPKFRDRMQLAFDVFDRFNPAERPVFWRMLLTQYAVHKAVYVLGSARTENGQVSSNLEVVLDAEDRRRLSIVPQEGGEEDEKLTEILQVAQNYLALHKVKLFDRKPLRNEVREDGLG